MVGLDGVEPSTSRLSGVRSNQLSYRPNLFDLSKPISELHVKRCFFISFLRKEVIQPLVPQRLPCYDFTLIINHTLGTCPPEGLA